MPLLYSEYSLDFDSVDDYVALGNVPELSFEWSDAFSISAWIKVPSSIGSTKSILSKKEATGNLTGWLYGVRADGNLALAFTTTNPSPDRDLSVRSDGRSLIDDEWHHVVVVYDGSGVVGGILFYADGELLSTVGIETDAMSFTIQITEGASIGSRNDTTTNLAFEGRMDEVSAYNKALSASEISTIYNGGLPLDLTVNGPAANLIGYWSLGEHSFPTVPDLSPSGNDGAMTNMAADDIVVDAPRPREAYYSALFDGTDEYITMGNIAAVNFDRTDPFSVSIWCKLSNTGNADYIISKQLDSGSFTGWGVMARSNGALNFRIFGSTLGQRAVVETTGTYADGEWHHFAFTYDGSSNASGMTILVDGVVQSTSTLDNGLASSSLNTAAFTVGSRNGTTGGGAGLLRGASAEVSVWGKELTLSEIQALYNGGRPRDARTLGISSNLVGYWPLDNRESFPTFPDLSTNGNNGTATNMEASDVKLDAPGVAFPTTSVSAQSIEYEGPIRPGYVEIGTVSALLFDRLDPFSTSFWFKPVGVETSFQALVGCLGVTPNFRGWEVIYDTDGRLRFRFSHIFGSDYLEVRTQRVFDEQVWRHVVVVYDGSSAGSGVTFFVDGVEIPVDVIANALTSTTVSSYPVRFGLRGGGDAPWNGHLDSVTIWSRALTEVEARTLYGSRGPTDLLENMPLANLEGYWEMGDSTSFPDVPDLSGKGNDGTMLGYLHQQRVTNQRPPGAATTQYSIGVPGLAVVPQDPSLDFGRSDAFTWSCWGRTTNPPNVYPTFMSKRSGVTQIALGVEGFTGWPDGGFSVLLAQDSLSDIEIYVNTNSTYNDGNWHHVAFTYDGSGSASGVTIYVDGAVAASTVRRDLLGVGDFQTTASVVLRTGSNNTQAGDEGNGCQYAIYDKELTSGEISTIYGGGTPPNLAAVGPTANLLGYWPVLVSDLGTGDLADNSGNNLSATLSNTTESIVADVPAPLVSEYSIVFDGVDDAVVVPAPNDLAFDRDDPITVMFWGRKTPGDSGTVFGNRDTTSGFLGWEVRWDESTGPSLIVSGGATSLYVHASPVEDGTWHHVALTYDGSSAGSGVRIFVDGAERATTIITDTLAASSVSTKDFYIGTRTNGSNALTGVLDEIAVYNRALSPSEVFLLGGQKEPVDHGAIGPVDALISWWRMGDPGPSVFPTIADLSVAQDNPGTMTNMTSGDIVLDVAAAIVAIPLDYGGYAVIPTGPVRPVNQVTPLAYGEASTGPGGSQTAVYKMRALADPGPGYVTWVNEAGPDFAGIEAPSPIQAGTAVIADAWGIPDVQQQSVVTVDFLQSVSNPVTATDPGDGITLVLVDTSALTWSDLDDITLPASPQNGAEVAIKDNAGQANVSRIEVQGNGNLIDGNATQIISSSWGALRLFFNGTEWSII